eukprot:3844125-Alexandrium_andersonii.AAC.1
MSLLHRPSLGRLTPVRRVLQRCHCTISADRFSPSRPPRRRHGAAGRRVNDVAGVSAGPIACQLFGA